jgi:hypothetical protein
MFPLPTLSFTFLPTHSFTHPPTQTITYPPTHSSTHSLVHSPTHSHHDILTLQQGILRDNTHTIMLQWSLDNFYTVNPGETIFAASDIGWVVGHRCVVRASEASYCGITNFVACLHRLHCGRACTVNCLRTRALAMMGNTAVHVTTLTLTSSTR